MLSSWRFNRNYYLFFVIYFFYTTPCFAEDSVNDVVDLKQALDLKIDRGGVAVAWSSDSKKIVVAGNYGENISIFDNNGELIHEINRAGYGPALSGSIAFVDEDRKIVFLPPAGSGNDAAYGVWDVLTGEFDKTEVGVHIGEDYPLNRIEYFSFIPKKNLLVGAATGSPLRKNLLANIYFFNGSSGKILKSDKISSSISSLNVFGDGSYVAVGTFGGEVDLINVDSGGFIKKINTNDKFNEIHYSIEAVAGDPLGRFVFSGVGLITFDGAVAYTNEGREWQKYFGITASARIFRIDDASQFASLQGAVAPIRCAAWDPLGRYVAFVDSARSLFIWAPWNSGFVRKFDLPSIALSLAISPNGKQLAVTTGSGARVFSVN